MNGVQSLRLIMSRQYLNTIHFADIIYNIHDWISPQCYSLLKKWVEGDQLGKRQSRILTLHFYAMMASHQSLHM